MKSYGKEMILDLVECDIKTFTRTKLVEYFVGVAKLTDMQLAEGPFFWEDQEIDDPNLQGLSAFYFIETSNIVIHTLNLLQRIFINVFSCKDFNINGIIEYTEEFFGGVVDDMQVVLRGKENNAC